MKDSDKFLIVVMVIFFFAGGALSYYVIYALKKGVVNTQNRIRPTYDSWKTDPVSFWFTILSYSLIAIALMFFSFWGVIKILQRNGHHF